MAFFGPFIGLAVFSALTSGAIRWRTRRDIRNRANAEYPVTGNDPTGRTIV